MCSKFAWSLVNSDAIYMYKFLWGIRSKVLHFVENMDRFNEIGRKEVCVSYMWSGVQRCVPHPRCSLLVVCFHSLCIMLCFSVWGKINKTFYNVFLGQGNTRNHDFEWPLRI